MLEEKTAADTFLMQIRDNTYWANERSKDRHSEMVRLLSSIRSLLIVNVAVVLGVVLAVGPARY